MLPNLKVSKHIGPYGPFKLNRRFAFSNFDAWGGNHNRGFTACIEAARGMCCVLDIGAHIGLVTLPLSDAIAKTGTVYAFEPATANRSFLIQHIKTNQIHNVEVILDLVGETESNSVEFFESTHDSGMNTLAITGSKRGYKKSTKNQTTLDRFCAHRNLRPELIKIDTEGAELSILKGAVNILKQDKPIIFLSVHPHQIKELGGSISELEEIIQELGYEVFDLAGNRTTPAELTEYIVKPIRY